MNFLKNLNIISQFFTSRMLIMLAMGFSSGLPLALTAGTLQAWMKSSGVDLTVIGAFSLVGLPYTFKFVWSPVIDAIHFGRSRRRGWMIITQIGLICSIYFMGTIDPMLFPWRIASLAFIVAFLSASQDIVIDAYRAELLSDIERGAGASVSNLGYRLAMITSGALALMLADHYPWQTVYFMMASLMTIGLIASFIAPEPAQYFEKRLSIFSAMQEPLKVFFSRPGAIEIIIFIVLYKVDIVMATALTTAFMQELGFSLTEIGAVTKLIGMLSAIAGSLVGGALYARLGLYKSLLWFGIIQGFSTLSFAILAEIGRNSVAMALTVGFENFCAGLATTPFIALLMALCDKRYTATQYALFSSLAALTRVFVGAPTGFLVKALGWTNFFVVCALTAIPALWLLKKRFNSWEIGDSRKQNANTDSK